jgi:ankyrin repeat protein
MLSNRHSLDFLISLENKDFNIDCQNIHAYTPLMVACTNPKNNSDIIQTLLRKNASVNKENQEGMTALHAACLAGSIEAVSLLLEHGADFTKKDKVRVIFTKLCCIEKHDPTSLCCDQRSGEPHQTLTERFAIFSIAEEVSLSRRGTSLTLTYFDGACCSER